MLNSQSKTYKFGETEFQVQRNVLKIQNAWLPVAMYFEKLVEMYTAECDMTAANVYKDRLKDLADKDKQDKSDLVKLQSEETPNTEIIERINKQIEFNASELVIINDEFSKDETALKQQAEYNRMFNYAIQSLITSYDVIKGFLEGYLIGDLSKLNYEDESIIEFIGEVIGDFFLYKKQNRN